MHKLALVESREDDIPKGVTPEEKKCLWRTLSRSDLNLLKEVPEYVRDKVAKTLGRKNKGIQKMAAKHKEVRDESLVDILTRVGNRRFLERQLEQEFARAERMEQALSVIFIDLDHFKEVNDSRGHDVGDQVLRDVVKIFEEIIRGQDTITRYGGDEFTILLPATDIRGATKLAEKLRKGVEGKMLEEYGVTASIGVTDSIQVESLKGKTNYEFLRELQKLADKALYAAKESGRNRVVSDSLTGYEDLCN